MRVRRAHFSEIVVLLETLKVNGLKLNFAGQGTHVDFHGSVQSAEIIDHMVDNTYSDGHEFWSPIRKHLALGEYLSVQRHGSDILDSNKNHIFNSTGANVTDPLAAATNKVMDMAKTDDVMHIKEPAKSDHIALAASALLAIQMIVAALVVFAVICNRFPKIFYQRAAERQGKVIREQENPSSSSDSPSADIAASPCTLLTQGLAATSDQVIADAGLDAWMNLEFQRLSLKILRDLHVVPLFLCPLYWYMSAGDEMPLSRVGMPVAEKHEFIWPQLGMIWFVILVVTQRMLRAQLAFQELRFRWLQNLDLPQARTLLIRGIPAALRADKALQVHFSSNVAVEDAYVVRKTSALKKYLTKLEQAEKKMKETGVEGNDDSLQQEMKTIGEEIRTERKRLEVAAETPGSTFSVCSDAGFVTFKTRRDMLLVLSGEIPTKGTPLAVHAAPAPVDVLYDGLSTERASSTGWTIIVGLFILFIPLVVILSLLLDLRSLHSLPGIGPKVAQWSATHPTWSAVLEGILPTFALTIVMSGLPAVFLSVATHYFKSPSSATAEVWVQRLMFSFSVTFILLGTAISSGLFTTAASLVWKPLVIVELLSGALPRVAHFYINYVSLAWSAIALEILRLGPLVSYCLSRMMSVEPEEARVQAEKDALQIGTRNANSAFMVVIAMCYSSLQPIIILFAAVYVGIEYIVRAYLAYCAEPKQEDLGGVPWVQSLKHVHVGLFIYALLMIGVMGPRVEGRAPFVVVLLTLPYLFWSWFRLNSIPWQTLPLDMIPETNEQLQQDSGDAFISCPYVQPELVNPKV